MGRGDVRGLVMNSQAKSIEGIYMRLSSYAVLKYDAPE